MSRTTLSPMVDRRRLRVRAPVRTVRGRGPGASHRRRRHGRGERRRRGAVHVAQLAQRRGARRDHRARQLLGGERHGGRTAAARTGGTHRRTGLHGRARAADGQPAAVARGRRTAVGTLRISRRLRPTAARVVPGARARAGHRLPDDQARCRARRGLHRSRRQGPSQRSHAVRARSGHQHRVGDPQEPRDCSAGQARLLHGRRHRRSWQHHASRRVQLVVRSRVDPHHLASAVPRTGSGAARHRGACLLHEGGVRPHRHGARDRRSRSCSGRCTARASSATRRHARTSGMR